MALRAKERGHRVLAITSLSHTRAVPASHPSGRKLADIADVVLDNAPPRGDALLDLPGGGSVCALATLTGVMLVQMTVAETASLLLAADVRPPVYVSANVPGGFEGRRPRPREAVRGPHPAYGQLRGCAPAPLGGGVMNLWVSPWLVAPTRRSRISMQPRAPKVAQAPDPVGSGRPPCGGQRPASAWGRPRRRCPPPASSGS